MYHQPTPINLVWYPAYIYNLCPAINYWSNKPRPTAQPGTPCQRPDFGSFVFASLRSYTLTGLTWVCHKTDIRISQATLTIKKSSWIVVLHLHRVWSTSSIRVFDTHDYHMYRLPYILSNNAVLKECSTKFKNIKLKTSAVLSFHVSKMYRLSLIYLWSIYELITISNLRFREIYPQKSNNFGNWKHFVRTLQLIGQPHTLVEEKNRVLHVYITSLKFLIDEQSYRDGVLVTGTVCCCVLFCDVCKKAQTKTYAC